MNKITKGKGIELLIKTLPNPHQISNIDLDKEDSIYFSWEDERFKFDLTVIRVDESHGGILTSTNISNLITSYLKEKYNKLFN